MTEHAQALESGGLNDLASFLDTPEEEPDEEIEAENTEESTGEEADQDLEENDDSDEPDEESDDEPAPVGKITLKVKGEDGVEKTVEVTHEEIESSFMFQQDYTKKTQALSQRENDAVQFFTQKHEESRNHYLQQAELTRSAIVNFAGFKSESEMAQLANDDPAMWVSENQWQRQISNYLNQLDQSIQGERQQAMNQASQLDTNRKSQMFNNTWAVLQKEGIDKPKLEKIYGDVTKNYGFSKEELTTVLDHRIVQVMRDAVAFRALKAQKADVTKKVQAAPRLPTRQTQPANERRDRALDEKFKSGRAKLNDLAAYLR